MTRWQDGKDRLPLPLDRVSVGALPLYKALDNALPRTTSVNLPDPSPAKLV